MKKRCFTSILGAALLLLACAGKTSADSQTVTEQVPGDMATHKEVVYQDTLVRDFHFMWRIDDAGLLHVKIMTSTTGWVAVGFAPTSVMKDANLIIGYVKADTAYLSDEFGVALTAHSPDAKLGGTDDIKEKSGMESEGLTEIHFAIPLNSGDKFDKVLEKGKACKIIMAAGSEDNFATKHARVASMMLTL